MKATATAFCFAIALGLPVAEPQTTNSADDGSAQPKYGYGHNLPGGVVYAKDGQNIYYNLNDAAERNLPNATGSTIKEGFAVSLNGGWRVWKEDSKFWVQEIPNGEPKAIWYMNERNASGATPEIKKVYGKPGVAYDFVWKGEVGKMALSPDGARFSFETVCQKPDWVKINAPTKWYIGTFLLSTLYNQNSYSASSHIDLPYFGWGGRIYNESFYANQPGGAPVITMDNGQQSSQWSSVVRKSACHLTFSGLDLWKKGQKLVYFIYQMDNQWGPIEIRLVDGASFMAGEPGKTLDNHPAAWVLKPGDIVRAWEIPVSLPDCQQLAIRPDGSLSVWCKGSIRLVDYSEIEKGMKAATMEGADPDFKGRGKKFISYANNVFRVNSTTIATGIEGTCLNWVTNDSFLFANKQGQLCLWTKGKVENLYRDVNGYFCYCAFSPFDTQVDRRRPDVDWRQPGINAPARVAAKATPHFGERKILSVASNQDGPQKEKQALFEICESQQFSVGGVSGFWWGSISSKNEQEASALLFVPRDNKGGSMQRTTVNDKHIEDIENPEQYFSRPFPPKNSASKKSRGPSGTNCSTGRVELVRYSEFEGKFFAIELIGAKHDNQIVVYKKRSWPEK